MLAIEIYRWPISDCNGVIDLWLNDHVSIAFNQIGILAMSYFFTVTGFLLFSGLSYGKISSKIRKRVKTLLIPYLVWELIATCYIMSRWEERIQLAHG